jgi:hypothetical protein
VVARRGPVSGTELGSGQAPPRPTLVRRIQARLARLLRTPHPTQVGVAAFAVAVLVVTALLMLPAAAETGKTTTFREALFTATSAVCVTGLAVVDTPTHWSAFGEVVCQPSAPRPVEREGQLSDPRGCNACSEAGANWRRTKRQGPKSLLHGFTARRGPAWARRCLPAVRGLRSRSTLHRPRAVVRPEQGSRAARSFSAPERA